MENRLKLRISRMFRSPFISSCRPRNISDVIQYQQNLHMAEPLSPKLRPFPSICRPKCPETITNNTTCCKVSEQYSPFVLTSSNGRMCPPASPYYECKEKMKHHSVKNKKNKSTHLKKTNRRDIACTFSSSSQENFRAWFSTDDDYDEKEDETDTLFSSKSLSSDSSELSLRRHHSRRRSRAYSRKGGSDVLTLSGGNTNEVKDSFVAVVKSSSDPYNDFRTSMVEMIVEKQIFVAKDLEQLLQCFLSLNSHHHHRIIVEVFTEIWEALFSNWP